MIIPYGRREKMEVSRGNRGHLEGGDSGGWGLNIEKDLGDRIWRLEMSNVDFSFSSCGVFNVTLHLPSAEKFGLLIRVVWEVGGT